MGADLRRKILGLVGQTVVTCQVDHQGPWEAYQITFANHQQLTLRFRADTGQGGIELTRVAAVADYEY